MWGAFLSIFAEIIISLGLAFQKAAHNELQRLQSLTEGGGGPPAYTSIKTWWIGLALMIGGELGNFLSYGDPGTAASVVAAVGCVSVISNYVISILWLKEPFRRRDVIGCLLVVVGVTLIVLFAPHFEHELDPIAVEDLVLSPVFLTYFGLSLALMAILCWVCSKYGDRHVIWYLSLCSLIGSYTPMSAKAVSTFVGHIASDFHDKEKWAQVFGSWIFYLMIIVMVSTAVIQVHFLNKAMEHFGNTLVVPCYWAFFTLLTIIGTGILYRDFSHASAAQLLGFTAGIVLTFSGVGLTASRTRVVEDYDTLAPRTLTDSFTSLTCRSSQ